MSEEWRRLAEEAQADGYPFLVTDLWYRGVPYERAVKFMAFVRSIQDDEDEEGAMTGAAAERTTGEGE